MTSFLDGPKLVLPEHQFFLVPLWPCMCCGCFQKLQKIDPEKIQETAQSSHLSWFGSVVHKAKNKTRKKGNLLYCYFSMWSPLMKRHLFKTLFSTTFYGLYFSHHTLHTLQFTILNGFILAQLVHRPTLWCYSNLN